MIPHLRPCKSYINLRRFSTEYISKLILEVLWFCTTSLCDQLKKIAPHSQTAEKQSIGSFSINEGAGKKKSLENKHLRNCDYFAIIPSCSHFTMLTKNPATGLV